MLFDVYKVSPGVYRFVGPYVHDDPAAHAMCERSDRYLNTVNNLNEAEKVVYEDHAESGEGGGIITRQMSVAVAVELGL